MIPDKFYNILKWVAQLLLPAAGTLYFSLSQIWGLPYGEQVVGTVVAIDTFLGVILGISSAKYTGDGTLHIDTSDEAKDVYRLSVDTPLDDISGKKTIVLRVNPNAALNNTDV